MTTKIPFLIPISLQMMNGLFHKRDLNTQKNITTIRKNKFQDRYNVVSETQEKLKQ